MSKAAPDTEAEAESGPTTTELSPGLEDVRADVRTTLAKIDDHGEHIKEAVGICFTAGGVDQEAAREIQALLAKQLGEVGEEHAHVGLPEIIAALWMELHRTSDMIVGDAEGVKDTEEDADSEDDTESGDAAEAESALEELFGPNEEADEEDGSDPDADAEEPATADPAFH